MSNNMMAFFSSSSLQIALCVLALFVLLSEQYFNRDIGFPHANVPANLSKETFNDNNFYEDTFFIKRSYADFIRGMQERKLINNSKVAELFGRVRRADFINVKPYYGFSNIPYAFDNQVVMEMPSYVALVLEQLVDHIKNGSRVLDIGSGQGYITTCLAHLVGSHGKVYGLEHDPLTCNNSLKNIKISSPELLQQGILEIIEKDGRWGHAEGGPYDAIFFGGGVPEVSKTILSQLKPNGRIVAPIGTVWRQNLSVIDKQPDGSIRSRILKRVTQDFLCTLQYQLHPEEFFEPHNVSSDEAGYSPLFPPPPGVRPRAIKFPLSDESGPSAVYTPPSNETLMKYTFLPESREDRYVFHQEILDAIHGPNKTKSLRKKNTAFYW